MEEWHDEILLCAQHRSSPRHSGLLAARYVGNRPNPLRWNDPFPFQQGIEAIGCEVLEGLNFPGRPADLQRLNLLCRP